MNFVIHWNETAMGLHVFPILIPPPTFNGPEPGGPESKREKEADIPWFKRKAHRVLFLGLLLLHGGTRRPLEWVKAQCAFSRGS